MPDLLRRDLIALTATAGALAAGAAGASAQEATALTCPRPRRADDEPRGEPREGVGLALSGGGYKAAVFHLGSLLRLNELGALPLINTISSVSGGSITSSVLAVGWGDLRFESGVAQNFNDVVAIPLMRFCRERTIDLPSFVRGIGPFSSAPRELARSYRRILEDATLADLPEPRLGVPEFIFNTTNMEQNTRFSFSRREAYDSAVGTICSPRFPLAQVVAASSAFPPIFAPFEFDMRDNEWAPGHSWASDVDERYRGRIALADGGIYDNMGLEPIWKDWKVLLVSNAGDPFPDDDTPPHQWFSQMRRVIRMMHRQAENSRKRWLFERAEDDITTEAYRQKVALWQIEGNTGDYRPVGGPAYPAPGADLAATHPVRLKALSFEEAERLYQHGYSMADAAVRTWWPALQGKPRPAALPHPPV